MDYTRCRALYDYNFCEKAGMRQTHVIMRLVAGFVKYVMEGTIRTLRLLDISGFIPGEIVQKFLLKKMAVLNNKNVDIWPWCNDENQDLFNDKHLF